MTVSYVRKAATANGFTFLKLLFRWRGSVWKLVHFELLVYLCLYNIITCLDNVFLARNEYGKYFGTLVGYCQKAVPELFTMVTFAMTFYVIQIYDRWWSVYTMLPWPDNLCFQISTLIKERGPEYKREDEDIRKRICRYLCLCYVMVFRDISERIKSRFPTLSHLEGSLVTCNEVAVLKGTALQERVNWMPIEWIVVILKKMYRNGQINDIHYTKIISCLMDYRERLHNIMQYDTVNLPLIYTQAVFVATYFYFFIEIIAIQRPTHTLFDMHWIYNLPIPICTIIEFLFLVGWLRSAEVMINPFGSDDDDFDLDLLIERNFYISFNIVEWAIRRKPKKEDIEHPMEFPKRNFESMVEDYLRPQHNIAGSAVPEMKKSDQGAGGGQSPLIPDVENQAAKITTQKVSTRDKVATPPMAAQETERKKGKPKPKILGAKTRRASRDTKDEPSTSKAPRWRTPRASRAESLRDSIANDGNQPAAAAPVENGGELLAEPRNLREKLELLVKIERKRDQMEEEWTQWDEDEEEAGGYNTSGMKTPKGSVVPSLRDGSLNVTQKTEKSRINSTQATYASVRSGLAPAPVSTALSATQTSATKPVSMLSKTSAQRLQEVVNELKAKNPSQEKENPLETEESLHTKKM